MGGRRQGEVLLLLRLTVSGYMIMPRRQVNFRCSGFSVSFFGSGSHRRKFNTAAQIACQCSASLGVLCR